MTAILGISAFYHDSAAALVRDGEIVAAAQEERFSRIKHDPGFPTQAVDYCLRAAGLAADQIDYVAFYDKPLTKFERLLETYLAFAPLGFRSFRLAMPVWLKDKLFMRRTIRRHLGRASGRKPDVFAAHPDVFAAHPDVLAAHPDVLAAHPDVLAAHPDVLAAHVGLTPRRSPGKLVFLDHHESHAASAFFPSPFEEAAILTLDGVGEWSTTTLGTGAGNRIRLRQHLQFPHSLGLLYSAFTYYCGFKVNSGEYKLMGLAPYGRPLYQDVILRHLVDLKPDGSFWLNMRYFNYCQGLTMTNARFDRLFGGKPRSSETQIEQRHMDLAASIQAVTEEVLLRLGRTLHQQTGLKNLVLAGGVALNCVASGRMLREGPFDDLWIQPAAGDAGGALGAALFVWHQLLEKPRHPRPGDAQHGSLLGPAFSSSEVRQFLDRQKAPYEHIPREEDLLARVAHILADGKIVGWFQGRMEFGPRALGARSILGDARSPTMQAAMNVKIKFRESFRPFAPVVLSDKASAWFDIKPGQESPYMLLVAAVRPEQRLSLTTEQEALMRSDPDLRKRVNVVRSTIPAVTHVDYSARLQTVDEARNPRFHRLLCTFERLTGCPVLVNTSFNVRGEPIVCSPNDAWRCFRASNMDVLVLEDCVVLKENLITGPGESEQHLAQFQAD